MPEEGFEEIAAGEEHPEGAGEEGPADGAAKSPWQISAGREIGFAGSPLNWGWSGASAEHPCRSRGGTSGTG